MSMKIRTEIRVAGTVAAFCLLTTACHKAGGPAGYMPPPPSVTVAEVIAQDSPVYLDEIGQGTAFESVTVTPQVSGVITERKVEDGADVKKGDLLFTIDPRPFQAQLDSAKAQLAASKAALELAKAQLDMYSSINDVRAVSKFDYDTKKNTVEVDKAQIEAAQATVEIAQLNLEYCHVHSPIDGRAGRRLVDVGNVVTANQTQLLSLQRLDPLYADFTITERDLPNVQEEMAHGTLKALVRLASDRENDAVSGELTFLDNSVQSASGTVNLRATIANTYRHFWPGQFMRVRLVLATKKNSLLVPNQATQISQQGPFVYVVKADGTADLRQVTLGQRQGDLVVIEKGVAAGERVVVTGQMSVNPGGKVRVDTGSTGTNSVSTTGATP
jgi:multidrug efflux system membrane fusion protein